MIVPEGGFLLPSSRVPGVCPGGMVLDEIDTWIISRWPINFGWWCTCRLLMFLENLPCDDDPEIQAFQIMKTF